MKLILKDEVGKQIEVDVERTDTFAEIVSKVLTEHGIDLDVEGLATIHPHMNVLDYFSSSLCYENKINSNEDTPQTLRCPSLEREASHESHLTPLASSDASEEICRLCAKSKTRDGMSPIETFLDKINFCLPIKVDGADKLSHKICSTCIRQLENFALFVDECSKADRLQRLGSCTVVCTNEISSSVQPDEKRLYQCDVCQKKFRSRFRLSFHLQFHEKNRNAGSCTVCGKEFPSEICLFKHFVYNHSNRQPLLCSYCGKSCPNKSSLCYHERLHTSYDAIRSFICGICDRRFSRKNVLRDHLSAMHSLAATSGNPLYECNLCNEVFPTETDGATHSDIHHGNDTHRLGLVFVPKLFICEFCDKCFKQSDVLMDHRRIHNSPDLYQCKVCNEEFSDYVGLQSHLNDHQRDGVIDYKANFSVPVVFVCEYCEACFVSYQSFRRHWETHHDEVYKCVLCAKSFSSFGTAKAHRASHSKVSEIVPSSKAYGCQICGKSFVCCSALTKHLRTHTHEKPFQCTFCSKKFSQSSGLYTHFKVHSDIRPYKCDICEKAFKIIGDYKVHIRRHTGERPFACSICSKAFLTKKTYIQHKRSHEGIKAYKCGTCQAAFRRSHTLKLHLKRHHQQEKLDDCQVKQH